MFLSLTCTASHPRRLFILGDNSQLLPLAVWPARSLRIRRPTLPCIWLLSLHMSVRDHFTPPHSCHIIRHSPQPDTSTWHLDLAPRPGTLTRPPRHGLDFPKIRNFRFLRMYKVRSAFEVTRRITKSGSKIPRRSLQHPIKVERLISRRETCEIVAYGTSRNLSIEQLNDIPALVSVRYENLTFLVSSLRTGPRGAEVYQVKR